MVRCERPASDDNPSCAALRGGQDNDGTLDIEAIRELQSLDPVKHDGEEIIENEISQFVEALRVCCTKRTDKNSNGECIRRINQERDALSSLLTDLQ